MSVNLTGEHSPVRFALEIHTFSCKATQIDSDTGHMIHTYNIAATDQAENTSAAAAAANNHHNHVIFLKQRPLMLMGWKLPQCSHWTLFCSTSQSYMKTNLLPPPDWDRNCSQSWAGPGLQPLQDFRIQIQSESNKRISVFKLFQEKKKICSDNQTMMSVLIDSYVTDCVIDPLLYWAPVIWSLL